jgi:hypothetical protein
MEEFDLVSGEICKERVGADGPLQVNDGDADLCY